MEHEVLRKKAIIIQSFFEQFCEINELQSIWLYIANYIYRYSLSSKSHFFHLKKFSLQKCMHVWSTNHQSVVVVFSYLLSFFKCLHVFEIHGTPPHQPPFVLMHLSPLFHCVLASHDLFHNLKIFNVAD